MQVAALYDIHGNLPALEAVLQDIGQADVDQIVVGGRRRSRPHAPRNAQAFTRLGPAYALHLREWRTGHFGPNDRGADRIGYLLGHDLRCTSPRKYCRNLSLDRRTASVRIRAGARALAQNAPA